MFELDDGLEELQEAAGEFVEEESEDAAGEAFDEFDSENLLAHWNKKEEGESLELEELLPQPRQSRSSLDHRSRSS